MQEEHRGVGGGGALVQGRAAVMILDFAESDISG